MKKYIVCGGEVNSKHDMDNHYIGPHTLCGLYGVNPMECFLMPHDSVEMMHGLPKDLPILRPRYDGRYKENSPKENQ